MAVHVAVRRQAIPISLQSPAIGEPARTLPVTAQLRAGGRRRITPLAIGEPVVDKEPGGGVLGVAPHAHGRRH